MFFLVCTCTAEEYPSHRCCLLSARQTVTAADCGLMCRAAAEKHILDAGNGMQRHEHGNTGTGGRGGGCKECVRSSWSEGEVIYTARKPPRYRNWTILASYHTVASASDHHCLSIFACDMTARAFVQRQQYCRAVDNRNTFFYV